jgi:hypothetical protein
MKTFVGRIVTVSEGAGRSVKVSKCGVAQLSRHQLMLYVKINFSSDDNTITMPDDINVIKPDNTSLLSSSQVITPVVKDTNFLIIQPNDSTKHYCTLM